jgi:hypothetical protein
MLLQAGGCANALRSLLKSDTERSPDFLHLANALSALYPKESEEERLVDSMMLAAPPWANSPSRLCSPATLSTGAPGEARSRRTLSPPFVQAKGSRSSGDCGCIA